MFKAPPPNLIEQLLSEETNKEPNELQMPSVSPSGMPRENKFIRVNNFMKDAKSPTA